MKKLHNIKKKRILLVSSKGGHFAQLLELEPMFTKYDYLLVTEKSKTTSGLASKYNMQFIRTRADSRLRGVSYYSIFILNVFIGLKIILSHFPKVIITTGSGTALPICILGKILGIKVIWIVSYARVNSKEKSSSLFEPYADKVIVQWPEMTKHYKKAHYLGGIY